MKILDNLVFRKIKEILISFISLFWKEKIVSLWILIHAFKVTLVTFFVFFFLCNSSLEDFFGYLHVLLGYHKFVFLILFSFSVNFFLFLTFFKYLFSFSFWKILIVLFYSLQIFFYFIYFSYAPYNLNYIDIYSLLLSINEGLILLKSGSIPLNLYMLFLIIDLPLLLILLKTKENTHTQSFSLINKSLLIFLLFLFFSFSLVLLDIFFLKRAVTSVKEKSYQEIVVRKKRFLMFHGLFNYNLFFSFYNAFKRDIKINDHNEILSRYSRTVKYNVKNKKLPLYNFILIQIESLPSGIIEEKYNNKLIMPYLNQLTKDKNTTYVKYMLTYHGASGSFDSTLAVINNIEPLREYPTFQLNEKQYKINNSIISIFKDQNQSLGYTAFSFENMLPWMFNAKNFTKRMGFDFHFSKFDMYPKKHHPRFTSPDHYMFDFIQKKMNSKYKPFFYFVTTMATHTPFEGINDYYTNTNYNSLRKKDENLANYFNTLSYSDIELKNFLKDINKNAPNSYIFIYGDHTYRDTQTKRPAISKKGIDVKLEFVPLIIISPENKSNKNTKIEAAAFSHDIGATILPSSKISYEYRLRGNNIFSKDFSETPIHYYELKLDRKKLFQEMEDFMKNNKKD